MMQTVGLILKGMFVGAIVGLFFGAYVVAFSSQYVFQVSDYAIKLDYEKATGRYVSAIILSFVVLFSYVGTFLAFASFGSWMRHALYGLVACIALVVGTALVGARINNERPFRRDYGAEQTCIDAARLCGIPASFIVGPLAGILVGGYWKKRRGPDVIDQTKIEVE